VNERDMTYQVGNHVRIVGGMFGMPQTITDDAGGGIRDFLRGENLLLTNARSGIHVLIEYLGCRRIWLPSYLCPSIVQCVSRSRVQMMSYAIDGTLNVATSSWLHDLQAGDLVLFIDYFGFPADDSIAAEVKAKGCYVLEDASQALLTSKRLHSADYILYSPRKFVGVPDGGILVSACGRKCPSQNLMPPPDSWWLANLEATIRRREFDACGVENDWFAWYLRSKKASPVGPYRMSDVSQRLLLSAFDYDQIANKRVENYAFLLKELADIALFTDLPAGVVPLGFPVRLRDRETIRKAMFNLRVYPAVHWAIGGIVAEEYAQSLDLSKQILTLPCDQRYGQREMDAMVRVLREHWAAC